MVLEFIQWIKSIVAHDLFMTFIFYTRLSGFYVNTFSNETENILHGQGEENFVRTGVLCVTVILLPYIYYTIYCVKQCMFILYTTVMKVVYRWIELFLNIYERSSMPLVSHKIFFCMFWFTNRANHNINNKVLRIGKFVF